MWKYHAVLADPTWETMVAPVIPPTWIREHVLATGQSIYWENTGRISNGPDRGTYPMLYRTDKQGKNIVTRLCPGSLVPVQDWLRYEDGSVVDVRTLVVARKPLNSG